MKNFLACQAVAVRRLVFVIALVIGGTALADIQDPPSNDYGPTRKLGRGISNFFLGSSEIFVTVGKINKDEGNSAEAGYGVVRGSDHGLWSFGQLSQSGSHALNSRWSPSGSSK